VSVCHTAALCKNGRTDRGPVRGADSWGPKAHCIRWGPDPPKARGIGGNMPVVKYRNIAWIDVAFAKLLWPFDDLSTCMPLQDYRLSHPVIVAVTSQRISVECELSKCWQRPGQICYHRQLIEMKLYVEDARG